MRQRMALAVAPSRATIAPTSPLPTNAPSLQPVGNALHTMSCRAKNLGQSMLSVIAEGTGCPPSGEAPPLAPPAPPLPVLPPVPPAVTFDVEVAPSPPPEVVATPAPPDAPLVVEPVDPPAPLAPLL